MDKEKAQYIREVAITQLETLKNLAKDDVKLSIDLELAINTLSAKTTLDVDSFAKNQPVNEAPKHEAPKHNDVNARVDYDFESEDYDDDDEDYYDEDRIEDYADYAREAEAELPVPNGFDNREAYEAFLATQEGVLPTYTDEEGEEHTILPDSMAGIINGEEVGNLDEDLAKISDALVDQNTIYDDEGNVEFQQEVAEVPSIKVSFARNDFNELTVDQVKERVLRAPESVMMLNSFGRNFNIVEGSDTSEKVVEFFIDNTNHRSRQASQAVALSDMVKFGGRVLIPGLGLVTAKAIVEREQY